MYFTIAGTLFVLGVVCSFFSSVLVWFCHFFQRNILFGGDLGLCGFDVVAETDWDSVQRRRLDGADPPLFTLIQNIWLFVVSSLLCFVGFYTIAL